MAEQLKLERPILVALMSGAMAFTMAGVVFVLVRSDTVLLCVVYWVILITVIALALLLLDFGTDLDDTGQTIGARKALGGRRSYHVSSLSAVRLGSEFAVFEFGPGSRIILPFGGRSSVVRDLALTLTSQTGGRVELVIPEQAVFGRDPYVRTAIQA